MVNPPRVRQTDAFGKTVSYDAEVLSRWGAFRTYAGTVFADRQVLFLVLVLFGVAIVAFLLTGFFLLAVPPTRPLHPQVYVPTLGMVSTLIGFVLGLYMSESLSRWRRLRFELLGGLWGQIHNVSLLLGAWLKDEDAMTTKDTVLRWALASHALLYYHAIKSTEGLAAVKAAGLITEEEFGILEEQPRWIRAQLPWAWIANMGQALADSGRIPGALTALPLLLDKCMQARSCIGSVGAMLATQLPFSYVHLLTWTVKSFLILFAAMYGLAVACVVVNVARHRAENEYDGALRLFLSGLVLILNACFFQGILNVQVMIRNPFGGDPDDFRTTEYHQDMFDGGSALLMAGARMPHSWTRALGKDARVQGDDSARRETDAATPRPSLEKARSCLLSDEKVAVVALGAASASTEADDAASSVCAVSLPGAPSPAAPFPRYARLRA